MKNKLFSKVFLHNLFSLTLLGVIAVVCGTLFYVAKRVKEPRYALHISEYLDVGYGHSVIFDYLKRASVTGEVLAPREIECIESVVPEEFVSYRYIPHFQPFVDPQTLLPVEGQLVYHDEKIPLRSQGEAQSASFWQFVYDRPYPLFSFDGAQMIPESEAIAMQGEEGILLFASGRLYKEVSLPEGVKKLVVEVVSQPRNDTPGVFDPRAHMTVYWDGSPLKETFVPAGQATRYAMQCYATAGKHTIAISFDNDFYDEEKGWDRNLLVKGVAIDQLLGAVHFRKRVSDKQAYFLSSFRLSYIRMLLRPCENELIQFFKRWPSVKSLQRRAQQDFSLATLYSDVTIGGVKRKAFFAPAPTTIHLPVQVPGDGRLFRFGFGVVPEAWGAAASGVEFRVLVQAHDSGQAQLLFSQELSPQRDFHHRRWFDGSVDLAPYKGKKIELILETKPATGDGASEGEDCESYGWAVWSD